MFAGIDYAAILERAQEEADVILWDGGNNDTPFVKPDVHIVVVDPHRPGHELRYHPGETNLRMADVCVVNKIDSATQEGIDAVLDSIHEHTTNATVVLAASPFHIEGDAAEIRGKRVLAIEDGPTLTHGDMSYGAAVLAAKQHGAAELVDPRPFAVGSIAKTFEDYPHVGSLLPAMGYGREQVADLRETIARSDADLVLIGTPIDLRRLVDFERPALRVTYRLQEVGEPTLADVLAEKASSSTPRSFDRIRYTYRRRMRGMRPLIGLGALAALVVLFVLVRPGGDDDDEGQAAPTTTAATTTAPTQTTATETEPPPAPTATVPKPVQLVVRVRGGKPLGGIVRAQAKKGDRVVVIVGSDVADEVHVHGYDLTARRRSRQSGQDPLRRDLDRTLRDRARAAPRADRAAHGPALTMLPLAHGIGGIQDPPIPQWLAYYGAAAVLVLSFAALGVLWRSPLLEREHLRSLLRLPRTLLRVLLGADRFRPLRAGLRRRAASASALRATNIAPTFIWVLFWLGLVPLTILFGNVWSWVNPWRAAADAVAWLWEKAGLEWEAPFTYPERLGRWPAAALLFAFAALELAYTDPTDPRMLALAIAIYSWTTWVGIAAFGREKWLPNGEAFTVYFGLLSRLSLTTLRESRFSLRRPLDRVARDVERPGTVAFVSVMLGSVAFDGFGRTSFWQDRLFRIESDLAAVGFNLLGLALTVAIVGAAYVAAVEIARRIGRRDARLEQAFIGSLIPIALAYVVAHYLTLLLIQGQLAIPLASDPFGYGWDLFGTLDFRVNVQPLSADQVWYAQAGALVVGHVLGLMIAHDKALALFGSSKVALRTQYAMLALMVLYTVGGLWLLSRG